MHLKQNTQFEASKKGSLIKWELRRLRTCIQKQESSSLELLQTGIDRLFFVFHIAERYNLQINSKPLSLIEKRRSICKHDIHPNEQVFFSKEVGMQHPLFKSMVKTENEAGYEFLRWWLPIIIQSDIRAHIALCDTDKSLEGTAKDLVYLQKDRLDESNE